MPPGFRGAVYRGEEAARRASLVSGPFQAQPAAYVVPHDEESLGALVRWCWQESVPLIPRGGGTGMPGGNLGTCLVVEVGPGLTGLDVLDPDAGRFRVGAGVVGAEADRVARQTGHFLPFLPSSAAWCSMGGMVANNAAGARSFRHGATASRIRTVEGFFSWGEWFRTSEDLPVPAPFDTLHGELSATLGAQLDAWPAVRKNSSGYALDRFLPTGNPAQLLTGSEGTLAILTHVELEALPLPEATGLAVLPTHGTGEVQEIAQAAVQLGTTTCEFLGRRFLEIADLRGNTDVGGLVATADGLIFLEVAGTREDVRAQLDSVQSVGSRVGGRGVASEDGDVVQRLWRLRHGASPRIAAEAGRGRVSTQFIEDSVVPPQCISRYLTGLDLILREANFDAVVFGHAGDGNFHVNPLVDIESADWKVRVRETLDAVTDLVRSLKGTLSGEHGDGRLRAPLLPRIWPEPLVHAFRHTKDTLDPRGILNPGVVLPLVDQDPLEGFAPRPRSHPG